MHYGGYSNADGTVLFYQRIRAILRSRARVINVGCGRGERFSDHAERYSTKLADFRSAGEQIRVTGVDPDPQASVNPSLDAFSIIDPQQPWAVPDEGFDVAVADFVLEHVADPSRFLEQIWRVLKPGGCVAMRTTNRWGYVGVGSRLIPNRLHARVVGSLQSSRQEQDVFPTYYRCNSLWALRSSLRRARFEDVIAFGHEAEPAYLTRFPSLYGLACRVRPMVPNCLRTCLMVFATKR